jgi:thioredoxin
MVPKKAMVTVPIHVTDAGFVREVSESPLPVLLDCWAPRCLPCQAMAPVIEELAADLVGTVKVAKLNVDENPEVVGRLGIRSIPVLLLYKNGKLIGEMVGPTPLAEIEAAVLRRLGQQ